MIRKMVRIDEEKCNGCGECVPSCAEGAIQIIDGKAKLLSDSLCDGLGACLGDCPLDAITIEEREADEYDETAVQEHLKEIGRAPLPHHAAPAAGGCPSAAVQAFAAPAAGGCPSARIVNFEAPAAETSVASPARPSRLAQWPVQLHLVPPTAPFFQNADVLLEEARSDGARDPVAAENAVALERHGRPARVAIEVHAAAAVAQGPARRPW